MIEKLIKPRHENTDDLYCSSNMNLFFVTINVLL
jgi:hypothetical protein